MPAKLPGKKTARNVVDLAVERQRRKPTPPRALPSPRPSAPLPNIAALFSDPDAATETAIRRFRKTAVPEPGSELPDADMILRAESVISFIDGALVDASNPIWPVISAAFDHLNGLRMQGARVAMALGCVERALSVPMKFRDSALVVQQLAFELRLADLRFAELSHEAIAYELTGARSKAELGCRNIGRGMKQAASALAIFALAVGAFGVPRVAKPSQADINKAKSTMRSAKQKL